MLSNQILSAQETERRRVSRELHEDFAQALVAFTFRLRSVAKELTPDQGELMEECEAVLLEMDRVILGVRRLSKDLSSSLLEQLGLWTAMRELATDFGRCHGIVVSLDLGDVHEVLPREAPVAVYRCIQEALDNVARHAQATKVSISVDEHSEWLRFVVQDDGSSFDPEAATALGPSQGRFGLATMDERMKMLGGTLEIESEPGKGTRITLSMPCQRG